MSESIKIDDKEFLISLLKEIFINFIFSISLSFIIFIISFTSILPENFLPENLKTALLDELKTPNIISFLTMAYSIFMLFIYFPIIIRQNASQEKFHNYYKKFNVEISSERDRIKQELDRLKEKLNKEIKKQSTPPEDHKQNIDKIKNDCLELTRQKKYHDVILNQYAFDAFQVIDNNWLFKYKINKFFEYINISLFCMVLNTWIANFFKFTSLDWNSLIVISLNYFIVGLFPLTSPLYKNHGCIRISLLIIWIITVFLLFKR